MSLSSTLDQALEGAAFSAAIVDEDTDDFLGFAQLSLVDLRHGTAQLLGALTPEARTPSHHGTLDDTRVGVGWGP